MRLVLCEHSGYPISALLLAAHREAVSEYRVRVVLATEFGEEAGEASEEWCEDENAGTEAGACADLESEEFVDGFPFREVGFELWVVWFWERLDAVAESLAGLLECEVAGQVNEREDEREDEPVADDGVRGEVDFFVAGESEGGFFVGEESDVTKGARRRGRRGRSRGRGSRAAARDLSASG
jgi:hypothetical protein